ncbi:MAG: TetR/AcrR family transcriptional regulator [Archangiaceae bacterium]|nr:TetR/AcrR family transcriptional regulator [Archangiaceae bacterium]
MQRPKAAVREAVLSAAARVFCAKGFDAATMPEIARAAGTATGNLYRYFPSKAALYEAVLPRSFVAQVEAMLKRRVDAYGTPRHTEALDALLAFAFAHRDRAVLLLGSHAKIRPQVVEHLVHLALSATGRDDADPLLRFALGQLYDNLLVSTLRAVTAFTEEAQARGAIEQLTRYHLGGLERLLA